MRRIALVGVVVVALGCGKKPTAMEACTSIAATGEVASCAASSPAGLGAAAVAGAKADLPSVAGESCQVLQFDKAETYDRTVAAFEAAAMLAGPHRYGNKDRLIFVQCNSGLNATHGAAIKAAVDKL